MNAPNDYLHAPACLGCLSLDVPVEEAGTEVPTCGPSATAPSAYTTEDRCGRCGSERLTYDRDEYEIACADSDDVRLAAVVASAAGLLATSQTDAERTAALRLAGLDLARMTPLARYVAAAALGLDLDDVEAAARG